VTWAMTAPFLMAVILPLSELRALIFIRASAWRTRAPRGSG
jgi:hypothetical protein